jgi:hypothetical protein
MRKEYSEIVKLANQNNCKDIFSWSKYKTYKDDRYSYFLKYIKKVPPDRFDGIYTKSGSDIHECVEDFYQGKLDHKGMLGKYEDLLFDNTLAGLKYDRTDEEKNEKIGNKYENCIRHFLLHHNKIPYDIKLEEFIGVVIGDIYFQGYIDAYHIEKRDGINKVIVTDWKSSSIYKGDKYEKEKGQLLLYIEGMHQKGIPYEKIVGRWNFLKYVDVTVTQKAIDKETKQHKTKVRTLERNNYVEKLKTSITMWLKQSKMFDGDIDEVIDKCISENSLNSLPDDVKDKFVVDDCYVEVPFTEQDIIDLKNDIVETVKSIRETTLEYNNTQDEMLWWQDVTDSSSYFMANLSEYSSALHKPYAKYLEEREMFLNEENKTTTDDEDILSLLDDILD